MLFEFHQQQNAKKPGSIRATYLLDGLPKVIKNTGTNGHQVDGEDVHMQSSPYMSSSMPHQDEEDEDAVPIRSIVLVREEELDEVKNQFDTVYSIHIYSLGPSSIMNLQILSDCNRTITTQFAGEDPLVAGKQYGVLQNSGVRRRTGRRPPGVAPSIAAAKAVERKPLADPKSEISKIVKGSGQPWSKPSERPQTETKPDAKAEPAKATEKKPITKPTKLKKEQSDIFKSFAKKPPAKFQREDTESSVPESAAADSQGQSNVQEDEPMKNVSSADEEEDTFQPTNGASAEPHKSHSERAEQLRKMMDEEEDEEMNVVPEGTSQGAEPPSKPPTPHEASPEPPVVSSKGRRRGRRKVMRKKMIKDEEGFLVTTEEPAWESFSEDEPALPKQRVPMSTSSSAGAKGKKGEKGGKVGQGNIKSFFGKK